MRTQNHILEEVRDICNNVINKNQDIYTHHEIIDIINSRKRDKLYKIYAISLDELYRPEPHISFSKIADITCEGNE